ncbi:sugar kinase [Mucilaginibacter myungsuensis]|uniref:Sugar kinase n=1 Tax=Mucilaginibacter myungsuensis TaxID=649104 RepID=A0A929L0G0_9SPHI|nr:sugar kinase [Mucilaginibacter myungsuensis]MBE9661875.1 sugar kinase [Mucilaginibacter myungsuensis]MDN3599691.1 sugar kinase [Mucilaginibacter myungsuensis]
MPSVPKKIVTLGEIMMRLSPPGHQRFVQADAFEANYGGGEANVAVALSNYGLQTSFVSKVPDNALGQAAINHLRQFGVDTQHVARGGDRLGLYFLETGAGVRASQVIYDRAGSAISQVQVDEFDFDAIFDGADWFHTSGITPGISDEGAELTFAALKAAKAKGITISVDINYRKKLWSKEKASQIMPEVCEYADVCLGADDTIGFPVAELNDGEFNPDAYKKAFEDLKNRYGFKYITSTIRKSHSASDNSISALIYDGTDIHQAKQYNVRIVDRVGTGDSYASGLIYGLITGMPAADANEFGIAAAALKHTIPGDTNHATVAEVLTLMGGDASGKVQR